ILLPVTTFPLHDLCPETYLPLLLKLFAQNYHQKSTGHQRLLQVQPFLMAPTFLRLFSVIVFPLFPFLIPVYFHVFLAKTCTLFVYFFSTTHTNFLMIDSS